VIECRTKTWALRVSQVDRSSIGMRTSANEPPTRLPTIFAAPGSSGQRHIGNIPPAASRWVCLVISIAMIVVNMAVEIMRNGSQDMMGSP
jgi:hypothetical protein